uniref:Major facilitator superfamily protein n=1 Tax=Ascaris lumbricoides TaxID=6252 RepID=A0A0M3IVP8_ASCLU
MRAPASESEMPSDQHAINGGHINGASTSANSTGLSSAAGTSSVGAEFGIDYVKVGVILVLYIAASSSDRFSPVAALCWRYEMNMCAVVANSTGLSSAAGTSSVGAEFGIDYVKVGVILVLYIAASSSERFSPVAALCWRYEMNMCAVVGVSWHFGNMQI